MKATKTSATESAWGRSGDGPIVSGDTRYRTRKKVARIAQPPTIPRNVPRPRGAVTTVPVAFVLTTCPPVIGRPRYCCSRAGARGGGCMEGAKRWLVKARGAALSSRYEGDRDQSVRGAR